MNVQLISKVYLKKHTSMAYTLNKKDSKMVCSMKKTSCSERERERFDRW